MEIRQATSVKQKLGFLLYGKQGTWKSSLCLEFAKFKREDGKPFRVLYIDAEAGSIDSYLDNYEQQGIDIRNILVASTQSLSEAENLINTAANNEEIYIEDENGDEVIALDAENKPFVADAIVLDGLSLMYTARQQALVEFSKKRAGVKAKKKELIGDEKAVAVDGASLEVKDYQTLKFDGQSFILTLLASGKHFAVTCREEEVKETVKGDDNKFLRVATGEKIPQGFKDVAYNVKTVLHLIADEEDGSINAVVEGKDRTEVHKQNEYIVNPTLLDWQVVIDKNKGKKDIRTAKLKVGVAAEVKDIESKAINLDIEEDTSQEEIEKLYNQISDTLKSLNTAQKAKAKKSIIDAGLSQKYRDYTDKETLLKYLNIVKG